MLLAALPALMSCTEFFTNSWASWAARDPDKLIPTVSAGNVDELLEMAEGDPDLSLAVLKKIRSASAKASGSDRQKLREAAIEASANAAGLGQAVLGAAEKLSGIDSAEDALDLVLAALNDMKNLEDASAELFSTLPKGDDADFDDFAAAASADDLALAAIILLAGEVKKNSDGNMADYIEEYITPMHELTEEEELALALADALTGRLDELSGPMKSVLEGLNLL